MVMFSVFVGFVAGMIATLFSVVLLSQRGEKCCRCGSRDTSRQFLNASVRKYLCCHRCGWEEVMGTPKVKE